MEAALFVVFAWVSTPREDPVITQVLAQALVLLDRKVGEAVILELIGRMENHWGIIRIDDPECSAFTWRKSIY